MCAVAQKILLEVKTLTGIEPMPIESVNLILAITQDAGKSGRFITDKTDAQGRGCPVILWADSVRYTIWAYKRGFCTLCATGEVQAGQGKKTVCLCLDPLDQDV